MERYFECGSCGHYHRESFHGDCREDTERFRTEEIAEGAEIVDLVEQEQMEMKGRKI